MPPQAIRGRKPKTGFCGNGQCEGTKPRGYNGAPMKVCTFWETCGCECHAEITRMFDIAKLERKVQDNPEYVPAVNTFMMPDRDAEDATGEPVEPKPEEEVDSAYPQASVPLPPPTKKIYDETPTGRSGKGQLEDRVKQACDVWLDEQKPWDCTPAYLSEAIASVHKIPAPSTGAIGAVFQRWADLKFADIGRQPIRFQSYTPEGLRLGLDRMKKEAKARKARLKAEIKRGTIR